MKKLALRRQVIFEKPDNPDKLLRNHEKARKGTIEQRGIILPEKDREPSFQPEPIPEPEPEPVIPPEPIPHPEPEIDHDKNQRK